MDAMARWIGGLSGMQHSLLTLAYGLAPLVALAVWLLAFKVYVVRATRSVDEQGAPADLGVPDRLLGMLSACLAVLGVLLSVAAVAAATLHIVLIRLATQSGYIQTVPLERYTGPIMVLFSALMGIVMARFMWRVRRADRLDS